MKKILSIALAVCMLASVLVMPASATLPTATTGAGRLLFSEDFNSGEAWASLPSVMANPGGNGSAVSIVDGALNIKFPEYTEDDFAMLPPENNLSGTPELTLLTTYGGQTLTAGWGSGTGKLSSAAGSIYRPRKWSMVFDSKAVENIIGLELGFRFNQGVTNKGNANGATSADMKMDRYASIIFNPVTMPIGETNTFKVTVDEGNRQYFNNGNNVVDRLKDNVQVWKKAEGEDDSAYTLLTYGTDYKLAAGMVSNSVTFGLNVANNVWANEEYTDLTDMRTTNAATYFVPGWGVSKKEYLITEYNIDNVYFYNEEPAIYEGVQVTYDMDTVSNSINDISGALVRTVDGGNGYMWLKGNGSGDGFKATMGSMDSSAKVTILMDVYNNGADADLGVHYTTGYHGEGQIYRDTGVIYIPAEAAKQGKWYTYKIDVFCRMSGGGGNYVPIYSNIYYKETGSNDPFVLDNFGKTVDPTYNGVQAGGTGSGGGNVAYLNEISLWYTGNSNGYFIDNVQVLEKDAIAGNVTKSGDVYTVDLTIAPTDKEGTRTPIVAVYDSNGVLVDMGYSQESPTTDGEVSITIDADKITDGCKVMVYMWDTISNGKPVRRTPTMYETDAVGGYHYVAKDITAAF